MGSCPQVNAVAPSETEFIELKWMDLHSAILAKNRKYRWASQRDS